MTQQLKGCYWTLVDLREALGTTPRWTSSWPLWRLPVLSQRSYRRNRSVLEAHDDRSLTSDRTSTKATNFAASSANTGEKVSVSERLRAWYATPPMLA